MEKLSALSGSAGALIILAMVVGLGLLLGKIKIRGVTFGSIWILFVGILLGHLGFRVDPVILTFVKDFGLILFIFMIGLQVGPGFFSSFRKDGLAMNLLAVGLVLLAAITTWVIHLVTGEDMGLLTGIMTGAVVNTPSLGAAQETLSEMVTASGGSVEQAFDASSRLASAYVVAYPLGVLGGFIVLIAMKAALHIDIEKEKLAAGKEDDGANAYRMACRVANPAIEGKMLGDVLKENNDLHFVVSRLMRDGEVLFPEMEETLRKGDCVLIVTDNRHKETVRLIFGEEYPADMKEWQKMGSKLVSRRLAITDPAITGKTVRGMDIRHKYGVTVTRIVRSGIELKAEGDYILQVGDVIQVVGFEDGIAHLAKQVGNQPDDLRKPNLAPIFIGIVLGILLGLLPIRFPSLFTAAVGLGAGENFVSSLVSGGYIWILYGAIITLVPLIIIAIVARFILKMDFFKVCGLLSGGGTNPPLLSFCEQSYGGDRVAVNYATVYPLTMFLRVVSAQILILTML